MPRGAASPPHSLPVMAPSPTLAQRLRRRIVQTWEASVRPHLPIVSSAYNGVAVQDGQSRLLDRLCPWRSPARPHYEWALVNGLHRHVRPGTHVVIVGGGWGVSAVHAARHTGSAGQVTVYEGARRQVEHCRETMRHNGVADRVTVHHALVGPAVDLHGAPDGAAQVAPESLPPCDLLALDCEGAETEILRGLSHRPRVLLVETHGLFGAPSDAIWHLLEERSYTVLSKTLAELHPVHHKGCVDGDVYVLAALRPEAVGRP